MKFRIKRESGIGPRWEVQGWFEDVRVWAAIGDAVDTYAEAVVKLNKEMERERT